MFYGNVLLGGVDWEGGDNLAQVTLEGVHSSPLHCACSGAAKEVAATWPAVLFCCHVNAPLWDPRRPFGDHRGGMQGEAPTFEELEASMLGGQKLQGVLTSDEVQEVLRDRGWERDYPLFTATSRIVSGAADVRRVLQFRDVALEEVDSSGEDPFGVAAAIQQASEGAGLPGPGAGAGR